MIRWRKQLEMCLKAINSIVVFVLALTVGGMAQSNTSVVPPSAWNDNTLITIQKRGGDPARPGDVKIEFYGHDAFKITSPTGLTVLADPWRNDSTGVYPKWFLTDFPAIRVDIVLSTHAHFDHDAVERPNGLMVLERMVGQAANRPKRLRERLRANQSGSPLVTPTESNVFTTIAIFSKNEKTLN